MGNVFGGFPALLDRLPHVRRDHLVHVGAHEGQEMPFYTQAGIARITLVEPLPHLAAGLRTRWPDATVVEAACSDTPGRAVLTVMARTNMSTLAPAGPHDQAVGAVEVPVRRLDDIAADATIAVVDAQGFELRVLAGAPLDRLDLVVVETVTVADPTMAATYADVDRFMTRRGWVEVEAWVRDQDRVARWARGPAAPPTGGEVRDVVYTRRR